jgi:hypothetical protein
MLFTGHLTILAINLFIEQLRWCDSKDIEKTYLGTYGKNFISLFAITLEIHVVEDRVFD